MKMVFIAFAFALSVAACQLDPLHAPSDQSGQTEREVQSAFQDLAEAARSLDHDRYFSFFDSAKFSILNSNATVEQSFEQFRDA